MKTWQFVAALTFLAACGEDSSSSTDAAPVGIDAGHVIPEPAAPWFGCSDDLLANAKVVTVHDKAPQYFSGWEDGQNQRIVDASSRHGRRSSATPPDGRRPSWMVPAATRGTACSRMSSRTITQGCSDKSVRQGL